MWTRLYERRNVFIRLISLLNIKEIENLKNIWLLFDKTDLCVLYDEQWYAEAKLHAIGGLMWNNAVDWVHNMMPQVRDYKNNYPRSIINLRPIFFLELPVIEIIQINLTLKTALVFVLLFWLPFISISIFACF